MKPAARAGRVIRLSPLTRYSVAVGAALGAVLIRLALNPVWGTGLPYITLFPAVMLSAWLGGLWPGIVTTLICAAAAEYFWIEPAGNTSELLGLLVFVVIGALMSLLNEAWRRGACALLESEERLNVTLASIGDAVLTTDEQGVITRFNAVAEKLTGWTAAEAVGHPLHDVFVIINELTRQPAQNPAYRVLQEGVVAGLANHTLLVARDGREIPIDDSAAPIRTDGGGLVGVIMVFRDISERRAAEREHLALLERERAARADTERVAHELRKSRREAEAATEQLRDALEAGGMGTWEYTVRTGAVKWSPTLEAIHGYAPRTFPGTFEAFQNEIHPSDRGRVLQAIKEAVQEGRDHRIEYRIVRADGSVRWVEGRGQLFLDEARSRIAWWVCVRTSRSAGRQRNVSVWWWRQRRRR